MSYKVEYSKNAVRQIKKLDNYTRIMILNWISKHLQNCENPFIYGKKLTCSLNGIWRYRVGDYRILCEIHNDELIILVLTIGHRSKVYR